ncbi:MAG: hypothetical protein K2M44_03100 [Clostridia bacterium]|nr:hypothetical protein [Clostridia bacterium]
MLNLGNIFTKNNYDTLEEKFLEKVERMTISFGGEDQIGLDTLRECLDITVDVMKTIADQNLAKDDYCKFYIQDVRRGSVIMDVGLITNIVGAIIPAIPSIIQIFIEIFKMRKHLKGKEPKNIEKNEKKTVIENCDGAKITVHNNTYNIYVSENTTERCLARMNDTLAKDPARTDLTIEYADQSGKVVDKVSMVKEELAQTSIALDVERFDNSLTEKTVIEWVKVRKCIFIGDSKWEFVSIVGNVSFSASIEDREFAEKFKKGEIIITPESLLKIKLLCRMRCDADGNTKGKTTYSVTKVLDIDSPQSKKQMSMFDNEDSII